MLALSLSLSRKKIDRIECETFSHCTMNTYCLVWKTNNNSKDYYTVQVNGKNLGSCGVLYISVIELNLGWKNCVVNNGNKPGWLRSWTTPNVLGASSVTLNFLSRPVVVVGWAILYRPQLIITKQASDNNTLLSFSVHSGQEPTVTAAKLTQRTWTHHQKTTAMMCLLQA